LSACLKLLELSSSKSCTAAKKIEFCCGDAEKISAAPSQLASYNVCLIGTFFGLVAIKRYAGWLFILCLEIFSWYSFLLLEFAPVEVCLPGRCAFFPEIQGINYQNYPISRSYHLNIPLIVILHKFSFLLSFFAWL
jgi:hypothetical protein